MRPAGQLLGEVVGIAQPFPMLLGFLLSGYEISGLKNSTDDPLEESHPHAQAVSIAADHSVPPALHLHQFCQNRFLLIAPL
jgi:hypothetical protein